jgi:hypothetical protein
LSGSALRIEWARHYARNLKTGDFGVQDPFISKIVRNDAL